MTTNVRLTRASVIAASIAVLAGCGTHAPKPLPASVTSPAPSTASLSPADVAQQEALTVYNAAIADWVHAAATSDNRDPHLADHMSGPALTDTQLALSSTNVAGIHFVGAPTDDPRVGELKPPSAPTQVFVLDCMNASAWIGRNADGSVADTGANGRHRIEAVVESSHGAWKVTHMIVRAVGTC